MKLLKLLVISAIIFTGTTSFAASRANKKIGIGIDFAGDPVPSLMSYQIKYNLMPFLQLTGGYGSVGSVTSYGLSAKAFVLPSWNFSPYVGAGFSRATNASSFSLGGSTVNSPSQSLNVIAVAAGVEHQSNIGFSFGAGINYFITPDTLKNVISMLPHFYLAWFF